MQIREVAHGRSSMGTVPGLMHACVHIERIEIDRDTHIHTDIHTHIHNNRHQLAYIATSMWRELVN